MIRRALGKQPPRGRLRPADLVREIPGGRMIELLEHQHEDFCQPLTDPPFVPAPEAAHMRDDDVVLGLAVDGEARAYPWWIMDSHHASNDVIGGQPVLVVLCEVCSSAMAFDPVVDGRRLTFAVSHMFNGTIAMRDHQTGSVWAPYLARAVHGPLKDTQLTLLPLVQEEWRDWVASHPDTLVLREDQGSRTGHGSQYSIGSPGVGPLMRATAPDSEDARLPHNALVLGVVVGNDARIYPLDALKAAGAVNDSLGGEQIVVLANTSASSYAALAFSRVVDGRPLTFEGASGTVTDEETGSTWTIQGVAVAGPLTGTRLRFVASHIAEWYAWSSNWPGIEIVQPSRIV